VQKRSNVRKTVQKDLPYLWQDEVIFANLAKKCEADDKDERREALDFVRVMMQENLSHARHVENERLTYFGFATASCAAAISLMNNTADVTLLKLVGTLVLLLIAVIGFFLTKRWSNAFDRHLDFARGCYFLLHNHLFKDSRSCENTKAFQEAYKEGIFINDSPSSKAGQHLEHLPLYCFKIRDPSFQAFGMLERLLGNKRTNKLFSIYYSSLITFLYCFLLYYTYNFIF